MSFSGVLLRRKPKQHFEHRPPKHGEIVFSTDTEEFGTILNGEVVWKPFMGAIHSINGKTGDIILTKEDVQLGNVDNTSDLDKPISTAVQAALDNIIYDFQNISKDAIGLGNVDNTSDLDKPISIAVQAALDNKLDKNEPSVDTLAVNGIPATNIPSKDEVYSRDFLDRKFATKANLNNIYTILEIDNLLDEKADKDKVYSKDICDIKFEKLSNKGNPNGYVPLDENGLIPEDFFIRDILEFNTLSDFPVQGKINTLYINKSSNSIYRYDVDDEVYVPLSSSDSNSEYIRTEAMKINVGGATVGTTFDGSIQDALDKILYPFIKPSFINFSTDYPNNIEIGDTISAGDYNFYWSISPEENVKSNSIKIYFNGAIKDDNLDNNDSATISLDEISHNSITTDTFKIEGTDIEDNTFTKSISIKWLASVKYGSNNLETLTDTDIADLDNSILKSTFKGTYHTPENGYKWICYPKSFGQANSFVDKNTGFNVAMHNYTVVTFTTSTGLTIDYYCYRTENQMASDIYIEIK